MIDPDKAVRDQAFKISKEFYDKLQEMSENPEFNRLMEKEMETNISKSPMEPIRPQEAPIIPKEPVISDANDGWDDDDDWKDFEIGDDINSSSVIPTPSSTTTRNRAPISHSAFANEESDGSPSIPSKQVQNRLGPRKKEVAADPLN
ncbi:Uncharacterized protein FKW44_000361 [Caligus rogercresseyi]|uniref:Uncharacterized protein n=1 Tax=Caligus rogercresseyi TaxID=217165 RepID=A0A7T8KHB2_CALRO|nr:Uncharacterized protein FKW44_000361 [Caligus rogercresseyi]